MTDQTESEESLTPAECVEYLDDIVANNASGGRNLLIPIELLSDSAAAIRALEAKVREAESEHAGVVATLGKALRELGFAAQTTGGTAGRDEGLVAAIDGATQALSLIGVSRSIDLVSKLREERDRLAGEVERLQQAIKRQASSARVGIDAATKISASQLREAARLHAESQPAAIESERAANEMLTAEVARLTAELDKARENEARYLWVRDAGHIGPHRTPYMRSSGYSPEEIDAAIDAARRAGGEG